MGAGIRILPWALAYMLSTTRAARLVVRFGQRRVVSSGMLIVAGGLAVLSRSGVDTNYAFVALGLVVTAIGMGFTTAPLTGAIMQSLPLEKAGVGSAVNDTTREVGGALGVAVFGSIVASQFHSSVDRIAGRAPVGRARVARCRAPSRVDRARRRGVAVTHAARQAYVNGLDATLVVAALVAVAAAGVISFLLRPNAQVVVREQAPAVLEAA